MSKVITTKDKRVTTVALIKQAIKYVPPANKKAREKSCGQCKNYTAAVSPKFGECDAYNFCPSALGICKHFDPVDTLRISRERAPIVPIRSLPDNPRTSGTMEDVINLRRAAKEAESEANRIEAEIDEAERKRRQCPVGFSDLIVVTSWQLPDIGIDRYYIVTAVLPADAGYALEGYNPNAKGCRFERRKGRIPAGSLIELATPDTFDSGVSFVSPHKAAPKVVWRRVGRIDLEEETKEEESDEDQDGPT